MDGISQGARVLLTEWICEKAQKELKARSQKVVLAPSGASIEEIIDLVRQNTINGIIVRACKIDVSVMTAYSGLRVIVKHGTGHDNINVEAATGLKIPVLYTPGANAESVAEYTVGLLYSIVNNIPAFDHDLRREHIWDKNKFTSHELQARCLGIIGLGKIGRRVVELLSPLDMRVLAFDPYVLATDVPDGIELVDDLRLLLCSADVISVHCPLTENTRHLLGAAELAHMKQGSYIINTARGGIIDEQALADALCRGHLAGAALDAFENEPIHFQDNPLLKLNNVIATPHVAASSEESLERMGL